MQFSRTYTLTIARPVESNYISGTEDLPLYQYRSIQDDIIGFQNRLDDTVDTFSEVFKPSSTSNIKTDLDKIDRTDYGKGLGSLQIRENHIVFNVSKKDSASTNKSEITVYNLSDASVSFLDSVSGKGVLVQLTVGYQNDEKAILLGTLESVEDSFKGVDRQTTIRVSEGGKFIRDSLLSKRYTKGTPVHEVATDMIDSMGLVKGIIDVTEDVLRHDLNVSGSTYQSLKRLAENNLFKVSVQDLSVNFVRQEGVPLRTVSNKQRIAKVFSSTTGLIGFVTTNNDNSGKTNVTSNDPKNGVTFSVLLDGSIKVGTLIKLDSVKHSGVYRVTEVSHRGSLEGNDWTTSVKAERADFR